MGRMTEVINLTNEQQEVVYLAERGHNICVFGKVGVGKMIVVKEITRILNAKEIEPNHIKWNFIYCI